MSKHIHTVKRNPYLPTIPTFKLLSIDLHRSPMSHKDIMTHNPALPRAIPLGALTPITRPTRSKLPDIIPENATTPWLIEGNPMLDF